MQTSCHSRVERFKAWWCAPATVTDRVLGALVGVFAGFWLGLLSHAAVAPSSLQPLVYIGIVITGCAILGVVFPKAATVVLFPFGVTGGI